VLQSARSAITSEATSRASIYLGALSSALVALGFASARTGVFGLFAAGVFPALVLLGEFTYLRLVQIAREDIVHLQAVQTIRRHYRDLSPDALRFFPDLSELAASRDVTSFLGRPRSRYFQVSLTAASLIGVISSIVAGVGAVLLAQHGGMRLSAAVTVGVAFALLLSVGHAGYQLRGWAARHRPMGSHV